MNPGRAAGEPSAPLLHRFSPHSPNFAVTHQVFLGGPWSQGSPCLSKGLIPEGKPYEKSRSLGSMGLVLGTSQGSNDTIWWFQRKGFVGAGKAGSRLADPDASCPSAP